MARIRRGVQAIGAIATCASLAAACVGAEAAPGRFDPTDLPAGPYDATTESLSAHELPGWFRDAKVGVFIHWGAYAVPAFAQPDAQVVGLGYSEWYWFFQHHLGDRLRSNGVTLDEYHLETFGADITYDDFLDRWRGERFDPEAWAALIADSGARYSVLVTKHHDGIALFDTRTTNRSTIDAGPRRDVIREATDALRDRGLKVGHYYSLHEWFHPDYLTEDAMTAFGPLSYPLIQPVTNPYTDEEIPYRGYVPIDDYVLDHMAVQVTELIDRYAPDLLWFDGQWDMPQSYWRTLDLSAYFFNRAEGDREVLVNDRVGLGGTWQGDYRTLEYEDLDEISPRYAEATRGLGVSFGYNAQEPDSNYVTADELVELLVDVVSKNGNLLINIGPRADGTVIEPMHQSLRGMGRWLRASGDSIYGSRPWDTHGDARVRFTRRDGVLYAHLLDEPAGEVQLPASVPTERESLSVVQCPGWSVDRVAETSVGTVIEVDDNGEDCGEYVWTVAFALP